MTAQRRGYDRDLLASKIEWEGGIVSALEYGIRSGDIEDSDLRVRWRTMEMLWDELRPLIRDFDVRLREPPTCQHDGIEDASDCPRAPQWCGGGRYVGEMPAECGGALIHEPHWVDGALA